MPRLQVCAIIAYRIGSRMTRTVSYVGLEKDLKMHGYDYNIALTVFYLFVSLY